MGIKADYELRLWMNVKSSRDGCWEWQACLGTAGYGTIRRNGRSTPCHRLSWELHFGEIPAGLFVCHHCDNRTCVRPDHLFLGSHQDNMDDMVRKGRARPGRSGGVKSTSFKPGCEGRKGEANMMSKLTDDRVREIRRLLSDGGQTHGQIAERFGVSPTLVCKVGRGKIWTHVT